MHVDEQIEAVDSRSGPARIPRPSTVPLPAARRMQGATKDGQDGGVVQALWLWW